MKTILLILILTFNFIGCKAQNPIVNILNDDGSAIENTYYKDVNNLLNNYEGTWLYTSGNSSLKIVLVKKTMQFDGRCYEDLIIGEYEYKVNGVVIISTLPNLNTNYTYQARHNLCGNTMLRRTSRPLCNDCVLDERRLLLGFTDPTTVTYGTVLIRRVQISTQDAIKIFIRSTGPSTYPSGTTPPTYFKVPEGEYTLIKQ